MTFEKSPSQLELGLSLCAFVFFPGGHTAPDMALLFVSIENFPNLCIKRGIVMFKPLGNVFVNRGLGDVVVLCS